MTSSLQVSKYRPGSVAMFDTKVTNKRTNPAERIFVLVQLKGAVRHDILLLWLVRLATERDALWTYLVLSYLNIFFK